MQLGEIQHLPKKCLAKICYMEHSSALRAKDFLMFFPLGIEIPKQPLVLSLFEDKTVKPNTTKHNLSSSGFWIFNHEKIASFNQFSKVPVPCDLFVKILRCTTTHWPHAAEQNTWGTKTKSSRDVRKRSCRHWSFVPSADDIRCGNKQQKSNQKKTKNKHDKVANRINNKQVSSRGLPKKVKQQSCHSEQYLPFPVFFS